MKMLVCTDGSDQSMKAVAEAVKIANACSVDEVTVIHVYSVDLYAMDEFSSAYIESYKVVREIKQELGTKIIKQALEIFDDSGLTVNAILEEGQPVTSILSYAQKGNYDMIVLGSRGLGGLKKLLLGSISNAIVQEANTNVYVVK